MIRYILWQFRHMHTFHFYSDDRGTYCPVCQEIYKPKEKKMPTPAPKPKNPISLWVALALGMLVLTAIDVIVGTLTGLLPLYAFAGVTGFAAVTFAVLSLRESV